MEEITQWHVTKYGQEIDKVDIEVEGRVFISTKVYIYKGRLYQELWNSGTCVHYSEIAE